MNLERYLITGFKDANTALALLLNWTVGREEIENSVRRLMEKREGGRGAEEKRKGVEECGI